MDRDRSVVRQQTLDGEVFKKGGAAASPKRPTVLEHFRSHRKWNIKRLSLAARRRGELPLFDFTTAGTSGKRPQELLSLLQEPIFSCRMLIDIRANPSNRYTPDWGKSRLAESLNSAGLEYISRPDLGVPSDVRRGLYSGRMSYEQLFGWYDRHVIRDELLDELKVSALSKHPVLLCTEIGPEYCHRHRLALALERRFDLISFDL